MTQEQQKLKREILFQAKRLDNGEWIGGYLYVHSRPLHAFGPDPQPPQVFILQTGFADWNMERPTDTYEVDPLSVRQYTGVGDKNKDKIFEHDIVSVEYGKGTVVFHGGSFWIEWIDDPQANMEPLAYLPKTGRYRFDLQILGNKFDNP